MKAEKFFKEAKNGPETLIKMMTPFQGNLKNCEALSRQRHKKGFSTVAEMMKSLFSP